MAFVTAISLQCCSCFAYNTAQGPKKSCHATSICFFNHLIQSLTVEIGETNLSKSTDEVIKGLKRAKQR